MKKKILMLCMGCFLVSLTAKAQWVVSDPGNLAQGIINAAKNIVHTSSTATNMANSFQETVKIYRQGKEYYDGLRKVKNLVRDARKVQQTILMVGDITDIYVTSFERFAAYQQVFGMAAFAECVYRRVFHQKDRACAGGAFSGGA